MEDSGFRIPSFCLRARMELSFDNSDGGVLTMESHRSVPAPFLTKTYHLVEDPATDDVVSWGEDGTTFVVWRPPDFAKDVLPNYFKHNNFSSFVRQLNTYGFRKIVSDRWEFANEFFKKGQQNLLTEIHRRKTGQASCTGGTSQSPVIAATRSQEEISWPHISPYPSAAATICDENERLRRDNCVLISELARLRRMNDEVFTFLQNNVRLPLQDLGCIRWTRFNHAALPGLLPAGPGSRLQEIDDGPGIKGRMDGSELIVRGCLAPFLKENAAPRASTLSFLDGKLKELAAKESVVRANAGPKLFGFPLRKRSHLNLPYQNDDRDPSPPSKRHSSPESKSSSESNSEDPYWLKLCRPSSSDSHQRIFL